MPKVTGIVKVLINSSVQRSKEGASIMFGGKERAFQTGHAVYGPSEKIVPSEIEFTVAHMADTDRQALDDLIDATVEFETDTGRSYVVTNAATTGPGKLTGGEGDLEYTINGDPAEDK